MLGPVEHPWAQITVKFVSCGGRCVCERAAGARLVDSSLAAARVLLSQHVLLSELTKAPHSPPAVCRLRFPRQGLVYGVSPVGIDRLIPLSRGSIV